MLPRLVSNSWPQVIPLLWPPKVLGLKAWATTKKLINLNIDKDDIILNEPILLIEYIGKSKNNRYLYTYKFTYNPYLSKLGIYIDEDFIWQSLVEFLSNKRSEKEITPEVSNENKILSKGFDLKTSFRPNMKQHYPLQ